MHSAASSIAAARRDASSCSSPRLTRLGLVLWSSFSEPEIKLCISGIFLISLILIPWFFGGLLPTCLQSLSSLFSDAAGKLFVRLSVESGCPPFDGPRGLLQVLSEGLGGPVPSSPPPDPDSQACAQLSTKHSRKALSVFMHTCILIHNMLTVHQRAVCCQQPCMPPCISKPTWKELFFWYYLYTSVFVYFCLSWKVHSLLSTTEMFVFYCICVCTLWLTNVDYTHSHEYNVLFLLIPFLSADLHWLHTPSDEIHPCILKICVLMSVHANSWHVCALQYCKSYSGKRHA